MKEPTAKEPTARGPTAKNPEETLVERARAGEREAFNELVAACRDRLSGFVNDRLGRDLRARVEVEDVVQDAILRGFLAMGRFEWRGEGSFCRWLAKIAENSIRDLARVRKGRESPLRHEVPSEAPSPSRGLRRAERFERLLQAYERLDPDHREVVRLARLEGLTVKEISERMGRSPSAVRHLLLRALQKLRDFFGGETESLHLPARDLTDGVPP